MSITKKIVELHATLTAEQIAFRLNIPVCTVRDVLEKHFRTLPKKTDVNYTEQFLR